MGRLVACPLPPGEFGVSPSASGGQLMFGRGDMKQLMPTDMKQRSALTRLSQYRAELELHAHECLKIRTKEGDLVPFDFNPIQRIIDSSAEEQKAETGMVRQIVLKSRRAGSSTYILGRGYSKATLNHGVSVAIVAHIKESANALYRIVKRFQEHNPIAPQLGTSNVRGLEFSGLDSRYTVFSAETEESGRGEELSFLHLSEAAYASKLDDIMAGLGNCVGDVHGTEIWLESTAKEPFGTFYERCMDSIKGASDYRLTFVPWSRDPYCYREPPEDFEAHSERDHEAFPSEREMMEMHGLTLGQICWRRGKMGGARNIIRFSREYPMSVNEAFCAVEEEMFVSPLSVQKARSVTMEGHGAVVVGVDPASMGKDRFSIAVRHGRHVRWVKYRKKVSLNEGLEWIKQVIEDEKPDRVNIDAGGGGNGDAICSALRDDPKYSDIIRAVNFGSTSQAKMRVPERPGPKNRKAEMMGRLRDTLESEEGLDIPDDEELASDLMSPKVQWINQEGDWQLVPKDKLKSRSHDLADAISLTYADDYVRPLTEERKALYGKGLDNYVAAPGLPPDGVGWMS